MSRSMTASFVGRDYYYRTSGTKKEPSRSNEYSRRGFIPDKVRCATRGRIKIAVCADLTLFSRPAHILLE